jgi:hypothetical protein
MVICLDTVGRKPVTVGRADDNSVLSKEECFSYTQNTIASPCLKGEPASFYTQNTILQVPSFARTTKMKQIRSFLRETLEKHIYLVPLCKIVTLVD